MEGITLQVNNPQRLCIYLQSTDKSEGHNLAYLITGNARKLDCSEINVYKGIMGYGASRRLYFPGVLALVQENPLLIEVVGSQSDIKKLLNYVDGILQDGFITIETIEILRNPQNPQRQISRQYLKDLLRRCYQLFNLRISIICISFSNRKFDSSFVRLI